MAAGFCLFVSFQQMTQIFSAQGVEVGSAPLLPLAILTGGVVCWRLLGHMVARQNRVRTFTAAVCLVAGGTVYVEIMSVSTSTLALSVGLQQRIQNDIEGSAEHQTATATQAAAGKAVVELANRLERLPGNYHTRAGQTAEQITELLQHQRALVEQQRDTGLSSTAQAFAQAGARFGLSGDDTAFRWALGIAVALSLIPLAVQLALGSYRMRCCSAGQQGARETSPAACRNPSPPARAGLNRETSAACRRGGNRRQAKPHTWPPPSESVSAADCQSQASDCDR